MVAPMMKRREASKQAVVEVREEGGGDSNGLKKPKGKAAKSFISLLKGA